jgi:hypothetical protein
MEAPSLQLQSWGNGLQILAAAASRLPLTSTKFAHDGTAGLRALKLAHASIALRSRRETGPLRGIRTPDPQVRSLMLYPTELGAVGDHLRQLLTDCEVQERPLLTPNMPKRPFRTRSHSGSSILW